MRKAILILLVLALLVIPGWAVDKGYQARIEDLMRIYNRLNAQIESAQRQISEWTVQRERIFGQILLLREMQKEESQPSEGEADAPSPEG